MGIYKLLQNFYCVIIHQNIIWQLNIFFKKYSILTFSVETSHEFRLNITCDCTVYWSCIVYLFRFLISRYLTVVCSNSTMAFRTKKNIMILNAVIWVLSGIFNIYTALIHEIKSIGEWPPSICEVILWTAFVWDILNFQTVLTVKVPVRMRFFSPT